jgi:hypothetical protein
MTAATPEAATPAWLQLPGESAKAYAAFCLYRDLGPKRSLVKAYRLQTGHEQATISGLWNTWRRKHRWADRAEAFDREAAFDLDQVQRQTERKLHRLRSHRQIHAHSAFTALNNQLIEQVTRTLPGLTLTDEVTPLPDGTKLARRASSPAHLARLLKQIRDLESCIAHGFPPANRQGS